MTLHRLWWQICSPTKICLILSTEAKQRYRNSSAIFPFMNFKLQGYLQTGDPDRAISICSLSILTSIRLIMILSHIKQHLLFPWHIISVPGSRFHHHNLNTYNKYFTFMTSVKNSWIQTKSWFCYHQEIIWTKTV